MHIPLVAKLRALIHHMLACVDMSKPLTDADELQGQQFAKAHEVQELLESSSSLTEEEEDSSDPEWCKVDKKNQESTNIEDTEVDGSKDSDEEEPIVVKATMVATPTVVEFPAATTPATTGPLAIDGNLGKEKGGPWFNLQHGG